MSSPNVRKYAIVGAAVVACGIGLYGLYRYFKNWQRKVTVSMRTDKNNKAVQLYTLKNQNGMTVIVSNVGAAIVQVLVPDRSGKTVDVVLGHNDVASYAIVERGHPYHGVLVGRYCNRIANSKYTIIINEKTKETETYELAANWDSRVCDEKHPPRHQLHGGDHGLHSKYWTCQMNHSEKGESASVTMSVISLDEEEGHPGTLHTSVTYTLTNENKLIMDISATTDRATHVNFTNHSYWNLAGHDSGSVLQHELKINGDFYTEVDDSLIPTGRLLSVINTPFDFRQTTVIGKNINELKDNSVAGQGYDLCYEINRYENESEEKEKEKEKEKSKSALALAAVLTDPKSGRVLTVSTTEPGIQVYTANWLNDHWKGKNNTNYNKFGAVCLETQHYANSPNIPTFPSTLLKPNQIFHSTTQYAFSTVSISTSTSLSSLSSTSTSSLSSSNSGSSSS
eukprot:TRINITY_DN87_c3_g2_i2.p1 TRINITY_DN87_c3_g2~~TRINITY_DN87_c3_g2_i2.p1  ORF type:complete len:453 (+),score=101.84 TRINITY_DN87_c3_g2_i2:37-1395(+)